MNDGDVYEMKKGVGRVGGEWGHIVTTQGIELLRTSGCMSTAIVQFITELPVIINDLPW